jgi:glycosyltransferase involved in cell wall biosynthesis
MSVWLLASGDFSTHGGMDRANFALARYLARCSQPAHDVHLVSHHVAPELASEPRVVVHTVPRPLGAERLGEPILRYAARRWHERLRSRQVRVVANGGNLDAGDLNWVHYVHAAFTPPVAGTVNRARVGANRKRYLDQERDALTRARIVFCNSKRTAADVVRAVGVRKEDVRVVYYGTDADAFSFVDSEARQSARRELGLPETRRLALFVGALGDRRKGFDTLFDSWRSLCARPDWDVDLVVAGTGAELSSWRKRTAECLPEDRIRFLGFRRDMPTVFAACDVLIHPARYEAYGLAVHEALCRGLPAIVSASAGVAERYPIDLESLLLGDADSVDELTTRLVSWRNDATIDERVERFASRLRSRTWDDMARDMVAIADERSTAAPLAASGSSQP